MRPLRSPITVTDSAIDQIKSLIIQRNKPTIGIRIGINSKGCSGMSYTFEYADNISINDEVIDVEDFKILIDPKSLLFVIGTTIDFIQDQFSSGFKFINPNEKGRCGCNKSFTV